MDEDPEKFLKTEEEKAQDAQRMQQAQVTSQAEAIKLAQAQVGIEAKKDIAVKGAESQLSMREEDQKHEHRLIEDGVRSKVAAKQKPKESQRGASNG